MAATSVSWLSPPNGSEFDVETTITLSGQAAGQRQTRGRGLDLVFVIDKSGSMGAYGKDQAQINIAKSIVAEHADKMIPGNTSILDKIGWIHYQKALQTIEHSLNVKPENPTVLYHLGEVQLALGMDDEAEESFQVTLKSPLPFEERQIIQEKLQQQ